MKISHLLLVSGWYFHFEKLIALKFLKLTYNNKKPHNKQYFPLQLILSCLTEEILFYLEIIRIFSMFFSYTIII